MNQQIENLARYSCEQTFDQLPETEPERSRLAPQTIPDSFWDAEMDYLAECLGREATDDEQEAYEEAWKERADELIREF